MEEKYINNILNFSDDIIGKGEELIINREQAKRIIKELEQDYVSKKVIKLILENLEDKICGNDEYLGNRQCIEIELLRNIEKELLESDFKKKQKNG